MFENIPPALKGAIFTILALYGLGFVLQAIDALRKHRAAKRLLKRRPL